MKYRIFGLVLFFAVAAFAQLNVRNFTAKNDMEINAQQDEDIEWYQAEQVQYDIFVRRGRARVNIPTNAVPIWRVWASATPTTLVVLSTGTVVSATDGHVRFTLTPEASNASTGTYVSLADVSIGSTNIGTIASSSAIIRYSPRSTNVAYSGTVALSAPFYVVAGDTLEGNMNAGGFTITNAGSITSTGTITGNLFSGDGGSLTNISGTGVQTPWTGTVHNASALVLTNLLAAYVGSNQFTYIPQSPLQIRARAWTNAALTTNHLDTGLQTTPTVYSVPIIAGEDAGLLVVSEREGGHGSFLSLMNLDASGAYGHNVLFQLAQIGQAEEGAFGLKIDQGNAGATSFGNFPLVITTGGVTRIGGTGVGGGGRLGMNVHGTTT
ncbi:MAG: hypothetical protein OEN49_08705, partial [Gammaproteobacteria bacterium]|nr:hypothetical protein [Gammaproteobacteria bacterium]